MADVVALGELLVDFVCKETDEIGYPTLVGKPGGAPGNYLAAVKKYGGSCAMIGKVGEDAFGRLLCQTLADAGIDLSGVIRAEDCFTTMAFVTLDETGNRHFSFARKPGADICLRSDEVNEALIRDCRVFHFGTLSMTDDPAREATRYAIRLAKAQGKVISLDPNLRKPLWPSEAAAKEAIEWSLHQADVVKISDEEIDFLWGIPRRRARRSCFANTVCPWYMRRRVQRAAMQRTSWAASPWKRPRASMRWIPPVRAISSAAAP